MINALIRASLANRPLVVGLALFTLVYGAWILRELPVDVLPDLTRPTVTLITEAPGMAPIEVENLVTVPIESAVAGVQDLVRLRSSSDLGLSLVFAEFEWGTDIYRARQMVQERLQGIQLPESVTPAMGPVSSLLSEILLVGVTDHSGEREPMEIRLLAERSLMRGLRAVPGVSQVLAIGGGVRQLEVRPDLQLMTLHGITLDQIHDAVADAASNAGLGYLERPGQELVIRGLAMTINPDEIGLTPVLTVPGQSNVLIRDVAEIGFGTPPLRGDAGVNGLPGVILSVQKSPGTDTIQLSQQVELALNQLAANLPKGIEVTVLFRQADFIENAVDNLYSAILDGALMVTLVLFLFLLNLRTTLITLLAIPLSFAVTAIVFSFWGIGVNSMTLGGMAIAIGIVVDDAIVDVENVFRRLRENQQREAPLPVTQVVADACIEVRSAIFYATTLIVLVFLPLFALGGMEGQLFSPVAAATITAMIASFLVAITVIPVLSSILLPTMKRMRHTRDGWVVRLLKAGCQKFLVTPALSYPWATLALTSLAVAGSFAIWPFMNRSFLPSFNEGSAIVSMVAAPGTSLEESVRLGQAGEQLLLNIPEIKSIGRRTGRAELDEHVMPVNVNEFDLEFHPSPKSRQELFDEIRHQLNQLPGVYINVGQPVSHRIDHMLSGIEAQVAVKIFGEDLQHLRAIASQVESLMQTNEGLVDINIQRQSDIPYLLLIPDREAAAREGVRVGALNRWFASAVGGRTVAQLHDGDMPLNLQVRLRAEDRKIPEQLEQLWWMQPDGRLLQVGDVAQVIESTGPSLIHRENQRRRMIVSANGATGHDLISSVEQLNHALQSLPIPEGYLIEIGGQWEAHRESTQRVAWLATATLLLMTLLLFSYFQSLAGSRVGLSLTLQTLLNIPLACAGALILTWLVTGEISLATLIGMIALSGIASRNTIMMLSHYLHLMQHEGESFSRNMVVRGTLERLVPVSMTALTAALGLLPLALDGQAPGREILHPVAIAIIGGLITSILLDWIVTPTVFYHFTGRGNLPERHAISAPPH